MDLDFIERLQGINLTSEEVEAIIVHLVLLAVFLQQNPLIFVRQRTF